MKAGFALDLRTSDENGAPWDLSQKVGGEAAGGHGISPCTIFSTFQKRSIGKRDESEVREKLEEAIKHPGIRRVNLPKASGREEKVCIGAPSGSPRMAAVSDE